MEKVMYSKKLPGNDTMESWELYTPICPNLEPVHYPDEILNPKCDEIGIQIVDFQHSYARGVPHTLHLHSITNQIKSWNEWSKNDTKVVPNYYNKKIDDLVSDIYHPFDYGYYNEQETVLNTEEEKVKFYNNVVNSRMDEVPDPRHRRLFSFILFNTEFDLLDVYLSEYYEIFDYIVIYESNATFSGKPKPLYLTRMLLETNRYDKFKDKIIAFPLPTEHICKYYQNDSVSTLGKPDLAIFDARRALGQYPKRYNYTESEGDGNFFPDDKYSRYLRRSLEDNDNDENKIENYVDPLTQPGFDPYKGYSYSDNTNDRKRGQGYVGEYVRFSTKYSVYGYSLTNYTLFWSAGWHMSSFLPTVDHFVNKLLSYAHYVEYTFMPKEKRRQTIINHINHKSYIFNTKSSFFGDEVENVYQDHKIVYPEDPEKDI
ncbi:glycosyltransferase family 17 protein [Piromyces sp. E2]|nr:glycosyltransferase family 17 protein [Piromyces sp. E2]|eukprot:OUM58187.1 glycosyltransferase family 17 protein [Piromyces sp. E2]